MRWLLPILLAVSASCYGVTVGGGSPWSESVPLTVKGDSVVSVVNSTTNLLGGDGVFTGGWDDTLYYSSIIVSLRSDVSSATNGFVAEFSDDQSYVVSDDTYTLLGGGGKTYSFQPSARYFRIVYTNGVSAQGEFLVSTQLKQGYVKPSSHRIGDEIVGEDDAELVKAALTGQDHNGHWHNVRTTHDGDLLVSDTSSGLSIARGDVEGQSFVHKFGNAPDFDFGDNPVTIWDGANAADINVMQYVYSTTNAIDSISSSSTSDVIAIEIQGVDADFNIIVQTNSLAGQTRVAMTTPLYRVFRCRNIGATSIVGSFYCYENTALNLGTPVDTSKIRAAIDDGNNQTEMAVYTIPAGKTGYMRDWYASIAGGNKTSNYIMELYARPPGQVFQLKHKWAIADSGTSMVQFKFEEPEIFAEGTDIELRVSATSSGVTAASISAGFDIVLVDD